MMVDCTFAMAIQNLPEDRRLIVGGLDKFNACRPGKADRCVKRVLGRPSAIITLDLRQCQKEEGARPDPRPSCRGGFQVMCRTEEHTSELQSLMRISYAVFCLKKTHIQAKLYTVIGELTHGTNALAGVHSITT